MYEYSIVPRYLPGGGGFGIKNFSLEALYAEYRYARCFWTKTNRELPLCRYLGCQLTLYQSSNTDYVFSYSNELPLESSLAMYNTMQPSMHQMTKHSILIPSKTTKPKKRPYIKIFVPPPTQLTNKWFFQQDLAKTPLVQTRTSAISIDNYYIDPHSPSTNITINLLNTGLIKNRQFSKNDTSGYYSSTHETLGRIYLYSTTSSVNSPTEIKYMDLIFLGTSFKNTPGQSWTDSGISFTQKQTWIEQNINHWGNPFHTNYLTGNDQVFQSNKTYATLINQCTSATDKVKSTDNFTEVFLTYELRYNPYSDQGIHNNCYFKSATKQEQGWDPPDNPDLTNENLPLWLLLWGFADYHRKIKKHQHLDDEWILTINTDATEKPRNPLVILNESWINGLSPHEPSPNKADENRWYPCLQFQTIALNNILLCGPGTPKIPKDIDIEAKMRYKFYFKWGGTPPQMSEIEDPKTQTTYPLPRNEQHTNSLQNPATHPETILYHFDQRRGQITDKALKRISKDWETKEDSLFSAAQRFQPPIPGAQESSPEETSSEEEKEETLYDQLQRQRYKQRKLRHRIMKTLQDLQNIQ